MFSHPSMDNPDKLELTFDWRGLRLCVAYSCGPAGRYKYKINIFCIYAMCIHSSAYDGGKVWIVIDS